MSDTDRERAGEQLAQGKAKVHLRVAWLRWVCPASSATAPE